MERQKSSREDFRGFHAEAAVDPYEAKVDPFTLELGERLVNGDRVALSRAITLSKWEWFGFEGVIRLLMRDVGIERNAALKLA